MASSGAFENFKHTFRQAVLLCLVECESSEEALHCIGWAEVALGRVEKLLSNTDLMKTLDKRALKCDMVQGDGKDKDKGE